MTNLDRTDVFLLVATVLQLQLLITTIRLLEYSTIQAATVTGSPFAIGAVFLFVVSASISLKSIVSITDQFINNEQKDRQSHCKSIGYSLALTGFCLIVAVFLSRTVSYF